MSDETESASTPNMGAVSVDGMDKAWLLPMDIASVFPDILLFSPEQDALGPGIENCPDIVQWLGKSPGVLTELLFEWMSMICNGGRVQFSFSRSAEGAILLNFKILEQNETGKILIEVWPPLNLLREEWEWSLATTARLDAKQELADRFLDSLPLGCFIPLPPNGPDDSTPWIEEHLTRKGRPLAGASGYTASEVCLAAFEKLGLLVNYSAREEEAVLPTWIRWVQDYVSGAFASPLLAQVSSPPLLATTQVVQVAADDLLDTGNLEQIELESSGADERVRAGFVEGGSEALGWYQPYHCYDDAHWGIYLHGSRILDLGRVFYDRLRVQGCPQPIAGFELAMRLILEHEMFHARMETFALQLELANKTAVFKPYNENVYRRALGSDKSLEEAVANYVAREIVHGLVKSWMQTRSWMQDNVDAVMDLIDELYSVSPPGYRHWYRAADTRTWRRLTAEAMTGVLEPEEPLAPLEPALRSPPQGVLGLTEVPIWVVGDTALTDRFFSTPRRREVERFLKNRGYTPRPGKGSHTVWVSSTGAHFTLPEKDPLSRLVFHNLLHHLGVSKQRYVAVRNV